MVKLVVLTVCFLVSVASPEPWSSMRHTQGDRRLAPDGVPRDPSAVGYLNLQKRHPDAAEGAEEFNTGYSSDVALQRLAQVQTFLASFRRLTERVRRTLAATELTVIGNTSAEMQTIGFHNYPLTVEGTILKQEYQLRQVQFELAQVKRGPGWSEERPSGCHRSMPASTASTASMPSTTSAIRGRSSPNAAGSSGRTAAC